jgi:ribosomal-protein-alanine N-acetyltransferase
VLSWLEAQIAQAAETGFCMWWWRDRATGELVGYAGLNRDEVEAAPIVEIGWSITPARWGEGLATEAARAAAAWGFERAGLDEVVSFALLDNVRSRRVMEKLGMTYARDFERAGLPHALYSLLRSRSPKGEAGVRRLRGGARKGEAEWRRR